MNKNWPAWVARLAAGALWGRLIAQLYLEWSTNETYSYGFVVPFLALYLAAERWKTRPAFSTAGAGNAALLFSTVCLALFFPLRIVQEANPDWRLLSWCLALAVVGLSFGLALWRTGRAWTWHFAFPLAFILTAVPWITPIETPLTQTLMRLDATAAVSILRWLGIPALQQGNLIQLSSGWLGVSEACSGIRSLQITLMISLFLGELYRFTLSRRLLLTSSVCAITLVCNLGRTFLLAWIQASYGTAATRRSHDLAGACELAASLVALWGVAGLLNRGSRLALTPQEDRQCAGPRPWPPRFMAVAAIWILCAEAGTELYYRAHEQTTAPAEPWSLNWPSPSEGFKDLPIPELTRELLKYSDARTVVGPAPDGCEWSIYFFHWKPSRTAPGLARGHRPEICLPSTGRQLVSSSHVSVTLSNGLVLPLRYYLFSEHGRFLHVWWGLWEGGKAFETEGDADMDTKIRLQAALHGFRNQGQQILEIALQGESNPEEPKKELAALLERILKK